MRTILIGTFIGLLGQVFAQPTTSVINFENGIALTGVIEQFDKSIHKLDTCSKGLDLKNICLIDGQKWYGGDVELKLPKNQLTSLKIKIQDYQIKLDVSGMFNPNFSNKLSKNQFKLKSTNDGYILFGYFSDGAGTYTTSWRIFKNKSVRQKISIDENDFSWQTEK